jgi:hypothetical protein
MQATSLWKVPLINALCCEASSVVCATACFNPLKIFKRKRFDAKNFRALEIDTFARLLQWSFSGFAFIFGKRRRLFKTKTMFSHLKRSIEVAL